MTFKRVLAESGLTKTELAALYGVSRQTIHSWPPLGTSPPRPGSYTERMATVITAALVNSLERGLLPLPAMDKEKRRARIARMKKTLQGLAPAPVKD